MDNQDLPPLSEAEQDLIPKPNEKRTFVERFVEYLRKRHQGTNVENSGSQPDPAKMAREWAIAQNRPVTAGQIYKKELEIRDSLKKRDQAA